MYIITMNGDLKRTMQVPVTQFFQTSFGGVG
jgi:hypothetical protein